MHPGCWLGDARTHLSEGHVSSLAHVVLQVLPGGAQGQACDNDTVVGAAGGAVGRGAQGGGAAGAGAGGTAPAMGQLHLRTSGGGAGRAFSIGS